MDPDSFRLRSVRLVSHVISPTLDGMVPPSARFDNDILVTNERSHITPYHVHTSAVGTPPVQVHPCLPCLAGLREDANAHIAASKLRNIINIY